MVVCHLLLGRPWQYDRKVIYDGFKNIYTFRKDGHKIALAPLKPAIAPATKLVEQNSWLSKSELEKEIRANSDFMAFVSGGLWLLVLFLVVFLGFALLLKNSYLSKKKKKKVRRRSQKK